MTPELPHLTQITLTDEERWLLNRLVEIASSSLAHVHANVPFDEYDGRNLVMLRGYSAEIAHLAIKLNRDRAHA